MRFALLVVLVLVAGCGTDPPMAPTPPVPACQVNNTAELSLTNASANSYAFDVLIDNITRGVMSVGQTLGPFTLSAGASHTVVSRVTNTTIVGCTSTASFAQCSTQTLTCRY